MFDITHKHGGFFRKQVPQADPAPKDSSAGKTSGEQQFSAKISNMNSAELPELQNLF